MAADGQFLPPGTKVYVPAVHRYYVVEDTCVECSEIGYARSREKLAECEDRLTMQAAKIIVSPPPGLPVKEGSACD